MFQRAESLIGGDSSKSSMKSKSFETYFLAIFRFGFLKVAEGVLVSKHLFPTFLGTFCQKKEKLYYYTVYLKVQASQ